MTAKSIIEIDVKDGSFNAFQANFDKYQKALASMPGKWGKTGAEVEKNAAAFKRVKNILNQVNDESKKSVTWQDKFRRAAEASDRTVGRLVKNTGKLAGHIKDATVSLLKWAGITSAISGLLGAGGLFGIDRLAMGAGASRRSAMGLGVTSGQQQAFGLSYRKYVDPDSLLSKVNEALTDPRKTHFLQQAGLNPADIKGKNAAEVADMLLPAAKKRYAQFGNNAIGAEAAGLTNFFSTDELQRLKNTSDSELSESHRGYQVNAKRLETSDGTLKKWQDLDQQLDLAWLQIKKTFIDGLAPLAPQLSKLSDAFAAAVATFLKNPQFGEWIDSAAEGIKTFANYLQTDDFKNNVKSFVEGVSDLSKAVVDALRMLGIVKTPRVSDNNPVAPGNLPNTGKGFRVGKSSEFAEKDARAASPGNWRAAVGKVAHAAGGVIKQASETPAALTGLGEADRLTMGEKAYIRSIAGLKDGLATETASPFKSRDTSGDFANLTSGVARFNQGRDTTITIINNTGGDAVVQTRQAAQ